MKIKITKRFIDAETGETHLPKKKITREQKRGQEIIDKGFGTEVKSKKK